MMNEAEICECPDCGAPKSATLVLGFHCEHERCPMLSGKEPQTPDETYQDACETYEEAFARSLAFQDACDDGGSGDD
jgi:predicted deacylase